MCRGGMNGSEQCSGHGMPCGCIYSTAVALVEWMLWLGVGCMLGVLGVWIVGVMVSL